MRVLIIQNFDGAEPGQVGVALLEKGAVVDHRRPYRGDPLPPDASDHDAMLVLGGAQSALDDEGYPYIPPLLELMRAFGDSERSVLGICLGSQLLARAYGGENLLGAAPELGWRAIVRTAQAADDPVLSAVPESFHSFQWHDDTFTLPPNAVHLASNGTARNQAFRIGRAAYGFQFHFEADTVMVDRWSSTSADYLAGNRPDWVRRYADEQAAHGPAADRAGLDLARAWVGTIRPQASA